MICHEIIGESVREMNSKQDDARLFERNPALNGSLLREIVSQRQ
jgi:hypothetical protein